MASVIARSRPGSRRNRRAIASVANQTTVMVAPMIGKSTLPRPPSRLKCDIWPRAAWPTMMTISSTRPATITQPVRRIVRSRSWPSIQASAREYSAIEIENFTGLNQSGAPTSVRWSTTASPAVTSASSAMPAASQ